MKKIALSFTLLATVVTFAATVSYAASKKTSDENAKSLMDPASSAGDTHPGKAKRPAQAATPKHKTVVEDEPEREYFKGSPLPEDNQVFGGLGYNYFDSFGIQARYAKRVMKYGFIPEVNDSFYVEGGAGMTFYGTYKTPTEEKSVMGFNIQATARWDFQVDPLWIIFADLGFGVNFISGVSSDLVDGGGLYPCVGVGAMYNFAPQWAVRGDLSYQFLGVGAVYRF